MNLTGLPRIARESAFYLLFGLIQIGIDWAVFVMVSHAGIAVTAANLLGRVSGACFGFWINGRVTFSGRGSVVGGKQAVRFALLWALTSTLSTAAMVLLDRGFGLGIAWLGKPVVDLALSALSFFISRHWVYRR